MAGHQLGQKGKNIRINLGGSLRTLRTQNRSKNVLNRRLLGRDQPH